MSDLPPPPPDAAPAPVTETDAAHRFPCPACGGNMRFEPRLGHLLCGHCGNEMAIEDDEPDAPKGPWVRGTTSGDSIREQDFLRALQSQAGSAPLEVTQVYPCKSCGAQVEFDPDIHAAACPFCAAPIVGEPGANRHIKPQGLLPFEVDERAAHDAMGEWLGRLWFAPSGLSQYARKGRAMDGIYIPYWTFDAQTQSRYSGARGDYYTTYRRNSEGERVPVRKIRWRPARGRVARFFDDVLVAGSRSLPPKVLSALPPWDLSRLAPYAPDYLAGLRAEAYSVELDDAYTDARAHMDRVIERDVRFDIGGDRQRLDRIDTDIDGVTFKHILLPVWVAAYRYRGEVYQVLINGQSGRVQGARPYSTWKIALAVAAGLIIAIGIAYGVAVTQQGTP